MRRLGSDAIRLVVFCPLGQRDQIPSELEMGKALVSPSVSLLPPAGRHVRTNVRAKHLRLVSHTIRPEMNSAREREKKERGKKAATKLRSDAFA